MYENKLYFLKIVPCFLIITKINALNYYNDLKKFNDKLNADNLMQGIYV
jgi:hypothetical protein